MRTFIELFGGGGLTREGLGEGWKCVYANDVSDQKAATYRANHGDRELVVEDVREVAAADLPRADLLCASFPCQDHSSAGPQPGFEGERGRLVFLVLHLVLQCRALGKAPTLLMLENVLGLATAKGGQDLKALLTGLASAGYLFGALCVDAARFVPQSRPRIFIVAVAAGAAIPAGLKARGPRGPWYPKALEAALLGLPAAVARKRVWWTLAEPPERTQQLADIVEPFGSPAERWRPQANVDRLVATCRPADRARIEIATRAAAPVYGVVVYKPGIDGGPRYLSVRTDGISNCLMGKVDLRYQQLIRVHGDGIGIRPCTAAELGRLMGLRGDYRMPPSVSQAAKLCGEGVAVPVVGWLAKRLLEPLADANPVAPRADAAERPVRARQRKINVLEPECGPIGLKEKNVATTFYMKPDQHERAHRLAAELGVSLQETLNMGLDRLFFERGQPPIERASTRRRPARAQDAGEGDITLPAAMATRPRPLAIAAAGVHPGPRKRALATGTGLARRLDPARGDVGSFRRAKRPRQLRPLRARPSSLTKAGVDATSGLAR